MESFSRPFFIHETNDYWVIHKPPGWLSIPARFPKPDDDVLTEWIKKTASNPALVEPFVVHRLDRFTSGIILYAKNKTAHQKANTWFQNREVKKVYHFLASPPPEKPAVQIKTPIQEKAAQTLFEVIEKKDLFFHGKATPLTGRFHQIREHAAVAGFPILGDHAHHGLLHALIHQVTLTFPRVMLHAYELTLPFGTFQAPLCDDFLTTKSKLNFVVK